MAIPKPDLILLALDPSPFQQLGKRALQSAGYEVTESTTRAALEKSLQESSPSLLLIGERLDGHSGLQLAALQLERFPTLPIILYAEKDSADTAKAVLQNGLSGYLHPPLRTDDIVGAVKRALQRALHLGDWVRREVNRTTTSLQRRINDFEAIFSNIDDSIVILDKHGCLLILNEAAQSVLGLNPEAVIGKPLTEVIQHGELLLLLERAANDNLKYHEINMDDGRVFNARYTLIPNIGSAITLQDITYLKEIDHVKNDFVHAVSHDLRSPLTSVLGYAELIGRVGSLNEQQQDFLNRLQMSVQAITALVNDLLDLGRLEAGFDTRRESVQLENILRYTVDMINGQAKAANIEIHIQQASNLPAVKANPLRLRQMLDNLIGNAIKYTPRGGQVQVHLHCKDSQVILQVQDNGVGIARKDQPHIFEKFYRGENMPEGTSGSGLGLAIVKSIVDSHQGRIWVESETGQGASFFVVLPADVPVAL